MYEQNDMPPQSAERQQDAIDINDFVFAATGARVRRLTTPDGEHWFPAVDVCKNLGYVHVGSTLRNIADATNFDSVESVLHRHTLAIPAGREWRRDMNLVNLQGLIRLVNSCTKPESQPFKTWVSEVIATIQRDGSYSLEPSPAQTPATGVAAYAMPEQVADAIVRLERRNLEADETQAALTGERNDLLRRQMTIAGEQNELLRQINDSLRDIAGSLKQRPQSDDAAPELTPRELLGAWRAKNLVVTDDIHAVAAYLAPALLRGGAHYRVEEIAVRTGLSHDRVHDSLRMLIKRGCMRQSGCADDGAPVYVLP
ncbi:Bro-N domain-containing protein [Streptomyces sp. NPDC091279]|uniref:BRO-N domain-containing protein n=1 Tax=Streptomyces sp. NPDC091279 TaxID=3365983 RepID=UPI0038193376